MAPSSRKARRRPPWTPPVVAAMVLLLARCISLRAPRFAVEAWSIQSSPRHARGVPYVGYSMGSAAATAQQAKRRAILASMLASPSLRDVDSSSDEGGNPVLRTLYDAPPRLPTKEDNATVSGNGTDAGSSDDNEDGWVTEVTPGTLLTEEGSSHVLYYEVHRRYRRGDPSSATNEENWAKNKRLTALFLHGGPGAGCYPNHVRFFSPELYETVVLLDQRGCGRSTPLGETENNTLALLVEDVERLRLHLLPEGETEIDAEALARPWDVILGGSWGCTLALAYAHSYPRHARAMVLRGVCLFRSEEIDWLFGDPPREEGVSGAVGGGMRTSNLRSLLGGGGDAMASTQSFRRGGESSGGSTLAKKETKKTASTMFPEAWREFIKGADIAKPSSSDERTTKGRSRATLRKYYNMLLGSDPVLRFRAVKSWMRWEMGIYSSGFGGAKRGRGNTETQKDQKSNTLLVWNPTVASWSYEDARVSGNHSVSSIDVLSDEVSENAVQSLRKFSSKPSSYERQRLPDSEAKQPIPVEHVTAPTNEPIPTPDRSKGNGTNATAFDPTTFVPAQSMLTCYYSANDDFCIGPYRSFLSLNAPPSMDASSWYSSKLPPMPPQHSGSTDQSERQLSMAEHNYPLPPTIAEHNYPLPPTIAIQGGNDAICPPDTALDLHGAWRELELRIALDGGHSMYDSVIAGEIVKATDRFGRALLDEDGMGF